MKFESHLQIPGDLFGVRGSVGKLFVFLTTQRSGSIHMNFVEGSVSSGITLTADEALSLADQLHAAAQASAIKEAA